MEKTADVIKQQQQQQKVEENFLTKISLKGFFIREKSTFTLLFLWQCRLFPSSERDLNDLIKITMEQEGLT